MGYALRPRARALLFAVVLASCRGEARPIELEVTRNGFQPALVRVTRGRPVELLVTRTSDDTCATEIVIP
jgi:hypothetical protein